MNTWSIVTIVVFITFIAMLILTLWPTKDKPYKDAEKLALKNEGDLPITPRHPD